jgi:hypothetical protein
MTTDTDSYEQQKKDRRRLRGKQTSLRHRFLASIRELSANREQWDKLVAGFQLAVEEDARLDPNWVSTDRYPLALYNLFTALGFEVYAGKIPRVSGVQPDYRWPMLAYHPSRAVLLDDRPSWLFADLAEIQPLCPVPILGLAYNPIVSVKPGGGAYAYSTRSLMEGRRVARALAMGHLTISFEDLREAIGLHPVDHRDRLVSIGQRTGVVSFLQPPIDALPVYGQHFSSNHNWRYSLDRFLADAEKATGTGAELSPGDVTQAQPAEVLADPEYYLKELGKTNLLGTADLNDLSQTQSGWSYLRSRVLPFPLGQLLYHACLSAREEVRDVAREAFAEALRTKQPVTDAGDHPLFLPLEEIDSFASVGLVSPNGVRNRVTVPEVEIKKLICRILGEQPTKDWGGEQNDIFTTRVIWNGQRRTAAFLLKGPAVRGRLTIAKCGKNGDQIQRLFQSPADIFFIQYNGEIDERVIEEARQKTTALRAQGQHHAAFSIVDGLDTARLIAAFP